MGGRPAAHYNHDRAVPSRGRDADLDWRTQCMPRRRRLSWDEFCDAVREAVESLPAPFHEYLENVVVDVQEAPTVDDYARVERRGDFERGSLLLGLFSGVPLTEQSYAANHPNVV